MFPQAEDSIMHTYNSTYLDIHEWRPIAYVCYRNLYISPFKSVQMYQGDKRIKDHDHKKTICKGHRLLSS